MTPCHSTLLASKCLAKSTRRLRMKYSVTSLNPSRHHEKEPTGFDHPVEVSKPLILDLYNNTQHFKINIYIVLSLVPFNYVTMYLLYTVHCKTAMYLFCRILVFLPNIILLPLISSRLDDWWDGHFLKQFSSIRSLQRRR